MVELSKSLTEEEERAVVQGLKPELRTVAELIENDEDYAFEFRSTARLDIREVGPNKACR